jgi:putative hydrolase of the HAD superfamily
VSVRERSAIRCVCFDWGGVILRICRSFGEGCRAAGLPLRGDLGDKPFANERKGHSEAYQLGHLDDDVYFSAIADAMGTLYSPAEVERVHHAWLIEEYPGVRTLIERLNETPGVSTALLSNTNAAHWRRQFPLQPSGLPRFEAASLLHHRHASHLLGLAKPDAAIHRAFEHHTGFSPAEILFFDDLADNIAAARDCGWHAEQIDHTGDTATQMVAHLVRHGVLRTA